MLKIKVLFV